MSLLRDIFGILQKEGFVSRIKENRGLMTSFIVGVIAMLLFSSMYGFAMGISVSGNVAIKNTFKLPAIFLLTYLIGIAPFIVSFRFVGGRDSHLKLCIMILSGFITSSIILAATSPIVFLYTLLKYVGGGLAHIIIIDIAILLGVYIMSACFYHSLEMDRTKMILPIFVGTLLTILALYLLSQFFAPFMQETTKEIVSQGVVSVNGKGLDIDASWTEAGFNKSPKGKIIINGAEFIIEKYPNMSALMDAINKSHIAEISIYYSDDRFRLKTDKVGSTISIAELSVPPDAGFFTLIKIKPGNPNAPATYRTTYFCDGFEMLKKLF